jgi:histidinol-phosphate/aromatic aminotransferase/cobyric acid decarboxylase-like protein/choline kinase
MKAIILAAGFGRRMRPMTDQVHKTLLEVGGETIMSRIIGGLRANGVTGICVVTGYRADDLETYLTVKFPDLKFAFVRNEAYETTNNIYSMALALEQYDPDDDIILIESDLLYEPPVLTRLINSPYENVALVDRYRIGMDGTVVSVADSNLITQVIPSSLQDEKFDFSDKYKTLNVYKFSAEFCRGTFRRLVSFYARTFDDNCYYELVLGILIYMQQVQVFAEILDGELWAEVDDPNDLLRADFRFAPENRRRQLESSWGGYWNTPITDFAFIRNMYFPPPSMLSELRGNLPDLLLNYGSAQTHLNLKLAYFLMCHPTNVVMLNGASQFYPMLRSWFEDRRVLRPDPTFGEYARMFPGAAVYPDRPGEEATDLDDMAAAADLIVVVNPNNPTGSVRSTESLTHLITRHPDKTFLIDESFIEFSGQPSIIPWLEAEHVTNVMVLKSLSKSLGVPGLRVGYLYTTNSEWHDRVMRDIPIWSVNSVAENFVEMLLKHRLELDASFERTCADREAFIALLDELPVVERVYPSAANFVLVKLALDRAAAAALADRLLSRDSIYVKDVSEKFPDGGTYWRLAVRLPAENEALCASMVSEGQ